MQWADTIRDFLPPVDPRSPSEIEGDIADEFAFHLAMLVREERAAGCDEETAKTHARRRFGDIERLRRKCKKIALEERVMLQRINLVLSIVVLLFVGLVGWQVWTTQKYNTLALQAITSDLANMKFEAEAEARANSTGETSASPQTADDNIALRANNTINYDLRDLPGVWRIVDREDIPNEMQLFIITDNGPSVPDGMIKESSRPTGRISNYDFSMWFALTFSQELAPQSTTNARLYVHFNPMRGPRESFNTPQANVDATWEPAANNRLILHLDPLLDRMTKDAADTARPWFEKPLVYERVTAPYTQTVKTGPPVIYHLLGDIPNPGPRKMSSKQPLKLQDVLREQNFGEIEHGVAHLFIPSAQGPKITASPRANNWEDDAYAETMVEPDSVIYITTEREDADSGE